MAQPLPQALRPLYLKVQAILQVSFPCLAVCRTPLWRLHHRPKMIMIGNGALLKIPDNLVGRKQVIAEAVLFSLWAVIFWNSYKQRSRSAGALIFIAYLNQPI